MTKYSKLLVFLIAIPCISYAKKPVSDIDKAKQTMNHIYQYYSVGNTPLLHENYPLDKNYTATYLATQDSSAAQKVAYLWPFSGTFSAVNALLKATNDKTYRKMLEERVLPGLEMYYDSNRQPACYQSYLQSAPPSDRFYDDNVWIAIDFAEAYHLTKRTAYLDKSRELWQFILSGCDDKLGGGIYWCEQKKRSKNTCSNAPAAVLAFKLFETTKDSLFFYRGLEIYDWTKSNLQDTTDMLYFDNVSLKGKIGTAKYAYNSGQMLQAAVLLYNLTGKKEYLTESQQIAQSCIDYFGEDYTAPDGKTFQLFRKRNTWFMAIMMRGFVELYHADHNKKYLDIFRENLTHMWQYARDKDGLFESDWSGEQKDKTKWLLSQAAMTEMYATLSYVSSTTTGQ